MGSEDSESRLRLLDAAQRLLQSEGHHAVTVRRVAAEAGLKRQLVHYYFRSMEELFLEILERAYQPHFERLNKIINDENPVRSIWNLSYVVDAILFEIHVLPLANQFPSIRESIVDFLTKSRAMQVTILRRFLDQKKADSDLPILPNPEAVALFLRGVARELAIEKNLGFLNGHEKALETIEAFLARFD